MPAATPPERNRLVKLPTVEVDVEVVGVRGRMVKLLGKTRSAFWVKGVKYVLMVMVVLDMAPTVEFQLLRVTVVLFLRMVGVGCAKVQVSIV